MVCLREGYGKKEFIGDLGAGLTVAVIALPLAMALGIGSIPLSVAQEMQAIHPWLTPPAMGLFTAVVAGFLISALGGSRVQIGGPTAAFMPLVFGICATYGYQGLLLATCMAGLLLMAMGFFRLGSVIKFVPYPVVTGFTAGIGLVIMASQLRDFFGLTLLDAEGNPAGMPAEFLGKLEICWQNIASFNWRATLVGAGTLLTLWGLGRIAPRIPAAVVAVAGASAAVALLGWSETTELVNGTIARPLVETIGTRFGGIPNNLPTPTIPSISWQMVQDLMPSALAIAFLGALESLLSAVVADGMTGDRHHSDQELVAQGVANVASACFFGLPATGAIARTAANVRSGGRTPMAGVLHAVFILLFMVAMAPLAKMIPLTALAAVLLLVAWRVSDLDRAGSWLRGPRPDVAALFTTLLLTVIFDLTIAVLVGIMLSSVLFMRRMVQVSTVRGINDSIADGTDEEAPDPKDPGAVAQRSIPPGVEVYEINGPFFFGVANNLLDALDHLEKPPKVIILRMRHVPHIDATGLAALREFHRRCVKNGTTLLLGGVHVHPLFEMAKSGFDQEVGPGNMFENLDDALARARELVGAA